MTGADPHTRGDRKSKQTRGLIAREKCGDFFTTCEVASRPQNVVISFSLVYLRGSQNNLFFKIIFKKQPLSLFIVSARMLPFLLS